jgi:hypothetical protein
MSYREIPINVMLGIVMAIGQSIGLKKKVEVSDHSVSVELTLPDQDTRAWDSDMFRYSNIFVSGYANPIKPVVNHYPDLEQKDTVEVEAGDVDQEESDQEESDNDQEERAHVDLISSARYRDYMRQDLVSQLLTPQEQWKLIAYGILGLGMLVFFQMVVIFWINGGAPA